MRLQSDRSALVLLVVLAGFALFTSSAFAQRSGGTRGGTTTTTTTTPTTTSPNIPRNPTPNPSMQQYMYAGKVGIGGAALADAIKVIARCSGTKNMQGRVYEAYTDYKGNFSLTVGQTQSSVPLDASIDSSDPMIMSGSGAGSMTPVTCELTASAAGFISSQMTIQFRSSLDVQEYGKLTITPMGGGDDLGGIISLTTLSAPDNARKEYSKGLSDLKDKKLDKAEKHLVKATEEYPKFAIAWHRLGLIQEENNQKTQAQDSFEKSIAADPKYVPPYLDLSILIAQSGKWDDVAALTTKAIAADSTHFPEAFFLNGVANLNAGHAAQAEKSALRAQELDNRNTNPRIQLLLAEIYDRTGRRDEAAVHFKKFLSLDPQARDADQVRARLAKLDVSAAAK